MTTDAAVSATKTLLPVFVLTTVPDRCKCLPSYEGWTGRWEETAKCCLTWLRRESCRTNEAEQCGQLCTLAQGTGTLLLLLCRLAIPFTEKITTKHVYYFMSVAAAFVPVLRFEFHILQKITSLKRKRIKIKFCILTPRSAKKWPKVLKNNKSVCFY